MILFLKNSVLYQVFSTLDMTHELSTLCTREISKVVHDRHDSLLFSTRIACYIKSLNWNMQLISNLMMQVVVSLHIIITTATVLVPVLVILRSDLCFSCR